MCIGELMSISTNKERIPNAQRRDFIMTPTSSLLGLLLSLFLFLPDCARAQKCVAGEYRTPWGSVLVLSDSGTYRYVSFECYHTVYSKGKWSAIDDTLRLSIDHAWELSDTALYGNTESFDGKPFLIRGTKLFFTYDVVMSRKNYFKKSKAIR